MGQSHASKDEYPTMLPRDYDGHILISDIDDTLRHTSLFNVLSSKFPQRRVRHARRTLFRIAERGVPIVYLSAAPARWMRTTNERFLSDFPLGVLIDRENLGIGGLNPFNQTRSQGNFKRNVLKHIAKAYPHSTLETIVLGMRMLTKACVQIHSSAARSARMKIYQNIFLGNNSRHTAKR